MICGISCPTIVGDDKRFYVFNCYWPRKDYVGIDVYDLKMAMEIINPMPRIQLIAIGY